MGPAASTLLVLKDQKFSCCGQLQSVKEQQLWSVTVCYEPAKKWLLRWGTAAATKYVYVSHERNNYFKTDL
jgi:hypothetical protein